MATLGLTNFGSLTAPLQPLSDFDNILGNESSATQGAGCIGYGAGNSYPPGSVGAAIQNAASFNGGTTSSRPAIPTLYQFYLDTNLGQPIWCIQVSPAIWINAAGVSV